MPTGPTQQMGAERVAFKEFNSNKMFTLYEYKQQNVYHVRIHKLNNKMFTISEHIK